MNKNNAKEYLPLVQALAEGKTLQVNRMGEGNPPKWLDLTSHDGEVQFSCEPKFYRVKPEPRRYWRVLTKDGAIVVGSELKEYAEHELQKLNRSGRQGPYELVEYVEVVK